MNKQLFVFIVDVLGDSIHSMMSASYADKKSAATTNGLQHHSPNSSPQTDNGGIFNYNNNSGKITSTSNPTYSSSCTPTHSSASTQAYNAKYQDDSHLYDCPADYNIQPASKPKPLLSAMVINSSVYADDDRIYDAPADVMMLPADPVQPPPVPSHSCTPPVPSHQTHQNDRSSGESADKQTHRSTDSSSSELTIVSSAASTCKPARELSSSYTEYNKVRQLIISY